MTVSMSRGVEENRAILGLGVLGAEECPWGRTCCMSFAASSKAAGAENLHRPHEGLSHADVLKRQGLRV
jgi:hypothetical protein